MSKPLIGITCRTVNVPSPQSATPQSYIDAIQEVGGAPILIPIGLDTRSLRSIFFTLDGLLLPGGVDVAPERYGRARHPMLGEVDTRRDELECALAAWALNEDLPILGICRGIQLLAVAAGGSLCQDLPSERPSTVTHEARAFGRDYLCHEIEIEPGSHLHRALGSTAVRVNSLHHQAVDNVPPGFKSTAYSEDGVIEGMEALGPQFAVGVQCHPESMWRTTATQFRGLFEAFVRAARHHHSRSHRAPGSLDRLTG